MRQSESITNLAPALVDAIAEIEGASKDGANPAFKRDNKPMAYATLDAVIGASKDILHTHGLVLTQWPGALADGSLTLETVIMHKTGEWIAGNFQIAVGRLDPQGVGSALTYARRYAQKAALNIPDLDDDANSATDQTRSEKGDKLPARDRSKEGLAVTAATSAIILCMTPDELIAWGKANADMINSLPTAHADEITKNYKTRLKALKDEATERAKAIAADDPFSDENRIPV